MSLKFEMSDKEAEAAVEWEYSHNCDITYTGAIGGKITYQFTPTTIGLVVCCRCACGSEKDVTDYSYW